LYSKFSGQAINETIPSNKIPEKDEDIENKLIDKVKLASIEAELKRTGVKTRQIVKEYKIFELKELTLIQWTELMKRLEKVPNKQKKDLGL